jgi:hypothetical protein
MPDRVSMFLISKNPTSSELKFKIVLIKYLVCRSLLPDRFLSESLETKMYIRFQFSMTYLCHRSRTTLFCVTHLRHWDLLYDECVTGTWQNSSVWHVSLGTSVWCMCQRDKTTLFCVTHMCHWDLLYDSYVTVAGQHSSVWHICVTGTFYMTHVSPGQDNTSVWRII